MSAQEQRREGWMVLGFTLGALAFLLIVGALLQ
jgi:preprotein translocase subunit SecE